MKTYLDSSFICSLYVRDANHPSAIATLANARSTLLLSGLGELEVTNAVELGVFRGSLRRSEADQIQAAFQQDVQDGIFQVFDLDTTAFLQTRKLILQHSSMVGCRTADILHVAAALECGADMFFSFDLRQKELARRVRLQTN